jgi:hypothetical protein
MMKTPDACSAPGLALLTVAALAVSAGSRVAPAAEPPGSNPIAEAFSLVFDSESIRLDIGADSLEVQGTYVLVRREPIEEAIPLFYPFPSDSLLGGARMVSLAFRAGTAPPAPGRWEQPPFASGVRWWVPPCRGDTIVAEAVYRQQMKASYARYIVRTTRIWGRPLRHASFEIRLPPGASPLEFSFPFEPREAGGNVSYVFDAYDFFPDHDIVVRWRP